MKIDHPTPKTWPSFRKKRGILLIKRWGAGFWSDVEHVIHQLVAAQALQRTPLVYWGTEGPYGNGQSETFSNYFEPVSDLTVNDLSGKIFPDRWNLTNLRDDLPFPATGYIDPSYKNYFLCGEKKILPPNEKTIRFMQRRPEEIVVSTCFEPLEAIVRYLPLHSPFRWLSADETRAAVVKKRLKLKKDLQQQIDNFWEVNFNRQRVLAIHLRGSDKVVENPALHKQNLRAISEGQEWISGAGNVIFLLTESEYYRKKIQTLFGERVIMQNCFRSHSEEVPNYLIAGRSGFQNGIEILLDTYTASRAERFIGSYSSNVSRYVAALGNFSKDKILFLDRS